MANSSLGDDTFNDGWLQAIENDYIESLKLCNDYLDEAASNLRSPKCGPVREIPEASNLPTLDHAEFAAALNLPKLEIQPFDGDPLEFHSFMNGFMINVDRACKDPDAKIARLLYMYYTWYRIA